MVMLPIVLAVGYFLFVTLTSLIYKESQVLFT